MSTYTGSLTKSYASFFVGCAEFAISPYTLTLSAFLDSKCSRDKGVNLALGIGACIFLSTVVPILPEIAAITFALAGFAACVGLATMVLTYPCSVIADAVEDLPCSEFRF